MGKLTGKRAIVTGGGQGLGESIVRHLLDDGADVVIHYFSSETGAKALKEYAQKLGRRAEIFQADLTNEAAATDYVASAVKFLGGLDVLVNNTGDLVQRRPLSEVDTRFWEQTMAVNVNS